MYRRVSVLATRRRVVALVAALGVGTAMVAASPATPAYADLPPLSCVMQPRGAYVLTDPLDGSKTIQSSNIVDCDYNVTDIRQWETLSLTSEVAQGYEFTPNYNHGFVRANSGVCLGGRQWTSHSEAWVDWPAPYTDAITGLPYSYVQSTYSIGIACGTGGGGDPSGGCAVACPGIDGGIDGAAAQDLTGAAVTVTGVAGRG